MWDGNGRRWEAIFSNTKEALRLRQWGQLVIWSLLSSQRDHLFCSTLSWRTCSLLLIPNTGPLLACWPQTEELSIHISILVPFGMMFRSFFVSLLPYHKVSLRICKLKKLVSSTLSSWSCGLNNDVCLLRSFVMGAQLVFISKWIKRISQLSFCRMIIILESQSLHFLPKVCGE
jgi:hypothetical protein